MSPVLTSVLIGIAAFLVAREVLRNNSSAGQSQDGKYDRSLALIVGGLGFVLMLAVCGIIGNFHIGGNRMVLQSTHQLTEIEVNGKQVYLTKVSNFGDTGLATIRWHFMIANPEEIGSLISYDQAEMRELDDGSPRVEFLQREPTGLWKYFSLGGRSKEYVFYLPPGSAL